METFVHYFDDSSMESSTFVHHVKDSSKYSPTTVYRITPATKKTTVEYYDDGKQISAGSTAIKFRNALYVSGVFDPKIVRKKARP